MIFRRKPFLSSVGPVPLTDRVRKVLARAAEEAHRLGHDFVGTEHLLLALLQEGNGVSALLFQSLDIAPDEMRRQVEEAVHPGNATVASGRLPYARRTKAVLELAGAEAQELGHSYAGTEHLLLALLREEGGIGADVLQAAGVTLESARAHLRVLLESKPRAPSAPLVQIDDASAQPIYEQIIAQIQEAVATGRLQTGERLPTVRQLADQLDIAPGTVARAYSELERLKVLTTEGARGTRVAPKDSSAPLEAERVDTLIGLLRPTAVAAFHLGATAPELRRALESAMRGILSAPEEGAAACPRNA